MDDFTIDLAGYLSKQVTSKGKTITIILEELGEDWWSMDIIGRNMQRFTWYDSFNSPAQASWIARGILKREGIEKLYDGTHCGYMDIL